MHPRIMSIKFRLKIRIKRRRMRWSLLLASLAVSLAATASLDSTRSEGREHTHIEQADDPGTYSPIDHSDFVPLLFSASERPSATSQDELVEYTHTPFSPYVAPRFPHMSEINSCQVPPRDGNDAHPPRDARRPARGGGGDAPTRSRTLRPSSLAFTGVEGSALAARGPRCHNLGPEEEKRTRS